MFIRYATYILRMFLKTIGYMHTVQCWAQQKQTWQLVKTVLSYLVVDIGWIFEIRKEDIARLMWSISCSLLLRTHLGVSDKPTRNRKDKE